MSRAQLRRPAIAASFCLSLILSVQAAVAGDATVFMDNGSQQTQAPQRVFAFPAKAAGVICGLSIGIPVRIGRDIGVESRRMSGTIRDDFAAEQKLGATLLGLFIGIPYGVCSGIIKGSIKGAESGVRLGISKPFSRESMSLGDLD